MSAPASAANVIITLPDGKTMTFPRGATGAEIAAAIGPGLAKAALILEVDGAEWDLFRPIERDAKVRIITKKDDKALSYVLDRVMFFTLAVCTLAANIIIPWSALG